MNSMKFQQTLETNISPSVKNLTQLRTDTGLPRGWRAEGSPQPPELNIIETVARPQDSSVSKTAQEAHGKGRDGKGKATKKLLLFTLVMRMSTMLLLLIP